MWITRFLTSSIGQKLIMSLTGLFLIIFLLVHLLGNLAILTDDGGQSFNVYADFMIHNPLIKTVSYSLYAFILIHAVQGVMIALKNKRAKGQNYKKKNTSGSWASQNMALLGILVLAFLFLHMGDFWLKAKFGAGGGVSMIDYGDGSIKDLYKRVTISFANPLIVIGYLVGLLALAFHLWHGFASAFQTLGLNHKKYTPLISAIGKIYSVLVPLGFAVLPIYIYLTVKA